MIRLLATLCLLTTMKCDAAELQVQTVRSGDDVTLTCEHYMDKNEKNQYLSWYKQSLGKVPDPVVRLFVDERQPRFTPGFSDGRFTVDLEVFDLSIKGIKEKDAGTYVCGKVKTNVVEFVSGTLLLFEAEKMDHRPLTEMVIETGESVTLQCSVQSLTSDCSGEHSVYWFRHGSGESHPGIIYTHGNRSDQCKSSSETDSSTQSCVYKLPKRKLSLSDAGTYYCAVAACGQILFGDGTEVNVQENNSWIIITLVTLNVTSVIVILILLKKQHNGAENDHPSHINQAEYSEVLKYAALNFAKRVKESQYLYTQTQGLFYYTQLTSSLETVIFNFHNRIMIRILITFCLFVSVKTSDTEELQIQTVKYGENVTVKCDHNFVKDSRQHYVAWYKQSFGKQPQLIVRSAESKADIIPAREFAERFRVTADEGKFDLSIINTVDEDTGTYFCVKLKDYPAEFGSGTLLLFTDERSQQSDVTEVDVKSGESFTLQCSVASLSCSGEHSVYWYRHGSGEPHPGIIYTHGNTNSPEVILPVSCCV
ncbi:hypothetical protein NFI96_031977 [Prochilodus magdalenae]|nr:hypothetical protein NFI96_031977 [Prochilodus magdalenae]